MIEKPESAFMAAKTMILLFSGEIPANFHVRIMDINVRETVVKLMVQGVVIAKLGILAIPVISPAGKAPGWKARK